MDGLQQWGVPLVGIVAAAAITFYAVSFSEIREKSFRDLDESEDENRGFKMTASSRERRARRKAEKEAKR
ncbi:uncharacterized protein LOC111482149 [Cucurbita maxima]|uniref:Uncharacterized protein LOC111482149 n=1 Tax=Cucurbita maxima TaxID=3661 RepID=A0A6J1J6A4_CUCMA|nr:uncharacterized protein LOC111482149 [Cucurbita maxima]